MLTIKDFFAACTGVWKSDRTYHYPLTGEVERSYTEFKVDLLTEPEKHQISSLFLPPAIFTNPLAINDSSGFAISFETKSETGKEVSMALKALFVNDLFIS